MNTFQLLLNGFSAVLSPINLVLCFVGVFLGSIVGVLPGLGPAATLAILLPMIYGKSAIGFLKGLLFIYLKYNCV